MVVLGFLLSQTDNCLGEFISNADATLVMAATGRISSEFNRLRDASWLSTAYTLGLCAAQPMVSYHTIFGKIGIY